MNTRISSSEHPAGKLIRTGSSGRDGCVHNSRIHGDDSEPLGSEACGILRGDHDRGGLCRAVCGDTGLGGTHSARGERPAAADDDDLPRWRCATLEQRKKSGDAVDDAERVDLELSCLEGHVQNGLDMAMDTQHSQHQQSPRPARRGLCCGYTYV